MRITDKLTKNTNVLKQFFKYFYLKYFVFKIFKKNGGNTNLKFELEILERLTNENYG